MWKPCEEEDGRWRHRHMNTETGGRMRVTEPPAYPWYASDAHHGRSGSAPVHTAETVCKLIKEQDLPATRRKQEFRIRRGPSERWVKRRGVGGGSSEEAETGEGPGA